MHFTRDPIVETIITPKEGYKLSIKSSKGGGEEYLVDAVEVVAFGQTFFYRSLERPKSFLLPVSDYEISEVKEVRLVVKNPSVDKLIKIAGGKETVQAPSKQKESVAVEASSEEGEKTEGAASANKRDRKRGRRGKRLSQEEKAALREKIAAEEPVLAPVVLSSLLTPPNTLISETLLRSMPKEATATNIEVPISQETLSGNELIDDYHDPLFSPRILEREEEDHGLVSEEPKKGEHLEDFSDEIPSHLNDHTHF